MILIDAHVHIYDCFDLDLFFDSALTNFQKAATDQGLGSQPFSAILFLAEGTSCHWFQDQAEKCQTDRHADSSGWTMIHNGDGLSLTACRHDYPEGKIHLVAGRQIVTAEKIEVLGLCCNSRVDDGLPLTATVDAIRQINGIPVIPWGVGKWFGQRGKILQHFLTAPPEKGLFLGDNGGRPSFWPTPTLFHLAGKKSIPILPGTDPLPLPHEAARVGSFGFFMDQPPPAPGSLASIVRDLLLTKQMAIHPFGRLQKVSRFFMNQLQIRS